MDYFLPLAAKSLLVAGATLLLLKLMQKRSAADRSLIAHLGLGALAFLPLAAFVFPPLEVESALMAQPVAAVSAAPAIAAAPEVATDMSSFPGRAAVVAPASVDWEFWAYAAPAGLLLLLTLIALLRLIPLKARANVLVDPHWLSALAHAQRRMGFKNGTALLTSEDIRSPISWGLMRPVILLSSDAADAHKEAEAIIAHELAHVAGLDWAKLLLARVTVAIFWFNPLVWLLAREAHQLREEAADDAVLNSNIEDTEYAGLLVGIAKHECRGLFLGAHGVAPARNSLARRVRRVLDSASERAPGGWRWSAAAAFFAAGMVVPMAALQLVEPTATASTPQLASVGGRKVAATAAPLSAAPSSSQSAAAPVEAAEVALSSEDDGVAIAPVSEPVVSTISQASTAIAEAGRALATAGTAFASASVRNRTRSSTDDAIDAAIEAKIHGVTPEYVREIRASSGALARVDMDDLVAFKIHGVTPQFIRELQSLGYRNLSADDIETAAVHGVNGGYASAMARAGYSRLSLDDLVEMKIMGVTPAYIETLRRAGHRNLTAKQVVKMKMFGVDPGEIKRSANDDP